MPTYNIERHTLLGTIRNDNNLDLTDPSLTEILSFGTKSFETNTNTNILNVNIEYVLPAETLTYRFIIEFNKCCWIQFINETLNKSIVRKGVPVVFQGVSIMVAENFFSSSNA